MSKSKGNFSLYLGVAGVLGALAYFGYKAWSKTHPKDDNSNQGTTDGVPNDVTSKPADTIPVDSPINYTTNPFKTKDEVKAFQQWVVNKYGKILGTSGSNKNGVDGLWGQKTASAWDKYGKTYMTSTSASTTTTTTTTTATIPSDVQSGIDNIVSKATGTKASQTYLANLYAQYPTWAKGWILKWSDTISKRIASSGQNNTAFAYQNDGVWDSYYGIKRADKNPIDKTATVKVDNARLWSNNYFGSSTSNPPKGQSLGTIKAVYYSKKDDVLFFYVPDNTYSSIYKWAIAPQTTF